MDLSFARTSLLTKALLAATAMLAAVFFLTGWLVQRHASRSAELGMEEEMRAGLETSESLWQTRTDLLASVSLVLSAMSDVRSAFSTGDPATIGDTASEMWSRVSPQGAFLLVIDPEGHVLASAGSPSNSVWPTHFTLAPAARKRFPQQAQGFWANNGNLYQIVITPVYVDSGRGPALLNVLVAGYTVDMTLAKRMQQSAASSEFILTSLSPAWRVIASTLPPEQRAQEAGVLPQNAGATAATRVRLGSATYLMLGRPLLDLEGQPLGHVWMLRSFAAAEAHLAALRRNLGLIWAAVAVAVLAITTLTVRSIVKRVRTLNAAAAQVAGNNYQQRLKVTSRDELGQVAETFNTMCASLEQTRAELVRQERLSTISRLTASLVHDLRNPLAAIYGGAEMLVDDDLPVEQVKRLATNIYRSSRQLQNMLQDLLQVTHGGVKSPEPCRLHEVVEAAIEAITPTADTHAVLVWNDVPDDLELALERNRMERVFVNLFSNAVEAMPSGGSIHISAQRSDGSVVLSVQDTGPGIREAVRPKLFQPFESVGKRNGLGLGLALSRQTVVDHGGDLWADQRSGPGACFRLRLPLN